MGMVTFVLALMFGVAAGALGVLGWRAQDPRARARYSGACAVALIQALTFGTMATYSSLQSPGYIVTLTITGVILIGALIFWGRRPGSTEPQ